jgi:hypothetical protein
MPSGSLVIVYMLRDYSFPFHKMCIIGQTGSATSFRQRLAFVALGEDDQ